MNNKEDYARYAALWETLLFYNGDEITDKNFLSSYDLMAHELSKLDFIKVMAKYNNKDKNIFIKLYFENNEILTITLCSNINQINNISSTIELDKNFKNFEFNNLNKTYLEKIKDILNNLNIIFKI